MARLTLVVGLLAALAANAGAASQGLFVDISGSTVRYHSSGIMSNLSTPLFTSLSGQGEVRIYGFNSEARRFPNLSAITPAVVGGYTHLGRTVEQAQRDRLALFWIITDNFEHDEGGQEGEGTEQFYNLLRGDGVKRVTVFPVLVGGGKAGLVVYAILLDAAELDAYNRGIDGFRKNAAGVLTTDALLMKPLDRDTVHTLVEEAADSPKVTYETGKPISKKIEVRFYSTLPHVAIVDSQIDVLDRQPQFQESSLLVPERKSVYINPKKIANLPGGGSTDQRYEIVMQVSRLKLKPGIGTLWKAAFGKNSEQASMEVALQIKVPRTNFRLHPDFLARFHSASPADAKATGRIYALDQLPTLMNDAVTAVEVKQEFVFPVKYPLYPALLFILMAVLLTLVLFGLIRFLRGLLPGPGSKWKVSWQKTGEIPQAGIIKNGTVLVGGDVAGRIENDAFTAGAQAEIVDPGPATRPLEHGSEVKLRMHRNEITLKFAKKGTKEAKGAAANQSGPINRR